MTEKFYIDRQFGQAIFIDVEDGIVLRCYNESDKFNSKMDEKYKGKPITFLKEDFEERMKPIYHNVRPIALYDIHQEINSWNSRIRHHAKQMNDYRITDGAKEKATELWNNARVEKSKAERKLEDERERILKDHNYPLSRWDTKGNKND